jgi:hypothetical protein
MSFLFPRLSRKGNTRRPRSLPRVAPQRFSESNLSYLSSYCSVPFCQVCNEPPSFPVSPRHSILSHRDDSQASGSWTTKTSPSFASIPSPRDFLASTPRDQCHGIPLGRGPGSAASTLSQSSGGSRRASRASSQHASFGSAIPDTSAPFRAHQAIRPHLGPVETFVIEVRDRTIDLELTSDPYGRVFSVAISSSTHPMDIIATLAPRGSGCEIHVCWPDGRRISVDRVMDLLSLHGPRCWLEIVESGR